MLCGLENCGTRKSTLVLAKRLRNVLGQSLVVHIDNAKSQEAMIDRPHHGPSFLRPGAMADYDDKSKHIPLSLLLAIV